MALIRCDGIVLKTYALGDTSRIVVAFTREAGMMRMVAKGARRTPSRFGFALEPLSRSRFTIYHKPDRDLQLVSQAECLRAAGSELSDLERLAHAEAAIELVDRLVWGEEPHPELYDLLAAVIERVVAAPPDQLPAVTAGFQLQLASQLGYQPRVDACAHCGGPVSARRVFSPARGGLLCDRCAAGEAGAITLSADALASLVLLLQRPIADAGTLAEARRAGELLRVIEAFLRAHFQRFTGLRSLEMLRTLSSAPTAKRENVA
jgi:DNA repair protein RecO (recombination protein O)